MAYHFQISISHFQREWREALEISSMEKYNLSFEEREEGYRGVVDVSRHILAEFFSSRKHGCTFESRAREPFKPTLSSTSNSSIYFFKEKILLDSHSGTGRRQPGLAPP